MLTTKKSKKGCPTFETAPFFFPALINRKQQMIECKKQLELSMNNLNQGPIHIGNISPIFSKPNHLTYPALPHKYGGPIDLLPKIHPTTTTQHPAQAPPKLFHYLAPSTGPVVRLGWFYHDKGNLA